MTAKQTIWKDASCYQWLQQKDLLHLTTNTQLHREIKTEIQFHDDMAIKSRKWTCAEAQHIQHNFQQQANNNLVKTGTSIIHMTYYSMCEIHNTAFTMLQHVLGYLQLHIPFRHMRITPDVLHGFEALDPTYCKTLKTTAAEHNNGHINNRQTIIPLPVHSGGHWQL